MDKTGIYKITNTLNGHRYVGSAISLCIHVHVVLVDYTFQV